MIIRVERISWSLCVGKGTFDKRPQKVSELLDLFFFMEIAY